MTSKRRDRSGLRRGRDRSGLRRRRWPWLIPVLGVPFLAALTVAAFLVTEHFSTWRVQEASAVELVVGDRGMSVGVPHGWTVTQRFYDASSASVRSPDGSLSFDVRIEPDETERTFRKTAKDGGHTSRVAVEMLRSGLTVWHSAEDGTLLAAVGEPGGEQALAILARFPSGSDRFALAIAEFLDTVAIVP